MKKALKKVWSGLRELLLGLVDVLSTFFGLNDNSKFGKVIQRIISVGFTVVVVVFVFVLCFRLGESLYDWIDDMRDNEISSYDNYEMSPYVYFHEDEYYGDGYVYTGDNKKTLRHVQWVRKPLGDDTLVCYSNGVKRGYFNKFTGKPVIDAKYDRAWVFSEGLAAVDDNGDIKFINSRGNVVIDLRIPYNPSLSGYVFHNGYCAVNDEKGSFGVIDVKGNWVISPIYSTVEVVDSFWIFGNDEGQCVMNFSMDTVMPMMSAELSVEDGEIVATFPDHTVSSYDLNGKLKVAFHIQDFSQLTYETTEIINCSAEDGYYNPTPATKVAPCMSYEAESGWNGLMTSDGRILTPPSYYKIEAISSDLYLCKIDYDRGVIVDGKGRIVSSKNE